jgi:ribosomal protein L11 methyltransferase
VNAPARRLLLRGAPERLAQALDLLHVHADVRGVEEREGECEVWLAAGSPARLPRPVGVEVTDLPVTADLFAHTGRERDAPVLVAADLCVRPPWVAPPPGFAGIDLVVPRGGAFGSGEHASTRAALLALHRYWPAAAVGAMADVGTGSGILVAYGARRRAALLVGCDIDPAAARAAADLVPRLRAVCGRPRALRVRAGVVAANLAAPELRDELADITALFAGPGLLVVGGLRGPQEAEACRRACAALGLRAEAPPVVVEPFTALAFAARAPAGPP